MYQDCFSRRDSVVALGRGEWHIASAEILPSKPEVAMIRNLTMALLITFVLAAAIEFHKYEAVRNAAVVCQLSGQLEQTQS
jgi:hypothetical protein